MCKKSIAAIVLAASIISSAHAADLTGQCVYPRSDPTKIPVYASPRASGEASVGVVGLWSSFTVIDRHGDWVKLISVPDYSQQEPYKTAGRVVGWVRLSDVEAQEPRNCT